MAAVIDINQSYPEYPTTFLNTVNSFSLEDEFVTEVYFLSLQGMVSQNRSQTFPNVST
jgi:hypothetical protein